MEYPQGFADRMASLLGEEWDAMKEAHNRPLRRGVRVNTLKITPQRFCSLFPHPLEASPFASDSFYLDAVHKAGSDPLYHAGAYYMQEPSASSAVSVLNPQPGEKILDMCAAPGGKTTQISALLQQEGLSWSNEYNTARAHILSQNCERMGGRNTVISNTDSAVLAQRLPDYFDAVLVDAPCSGEGMFRKEPQALEMWTEDAPDLCAERQWEILVNAAKTLRPGGRLVYSTCTFSPEENECLIARFLEENPVFSLVPISATWGRQGFSFDKVKPFTDLSSCSADLTYCRRILPMDGGEGHFIALLKKDESAPRNGQTAPYTPPSKDANRSEAVNLYEDCFRSAPTGHFVTVGDTVYLLPMELPAIQKCGVLRAGVPVATVCKNRLEPSHGIFLASNGNDCRRFLDFSADDPSILSFLHGEELPVSAEKGWTAVGVYGLPLGFGKVSGERLKNRYPKGLRLLK